MFNKEAFLAFKQKASGNVGYENEAAHKKHKVKEKDGSTSVYWEIGRWSYHDNYFGGEPYGGREVVFFDGQPVHMTVYYGWVHEKTDTDLVYDFLRRALRANQNPALSRGPKEFREGQHLYKNIYRGDINHFSGEEKIYENKKLIYRATYAGGLVDQRKSG